MPVWTGSLFSAGCSVQSYNCHECMQGCDLCLPSPHALPSTTIHGGETSHWLLARMVALTFMSKDAVLWILVLGGTTVLEWAHFYSESELIFSDLLWTLPPTTNNPFDPKEVQQYVLDRQRALEAMALQIWVTSSLPGVKGGEGRSWPAPWAKRRFSWCTGGGGGRGAPSCLLWTPLSLCQKASLEK